MKKKHIRFLSFFLGASVLIILLVNLGINFWLQNKLPGYIKTNTAYKLNYKNLNVDAFTGNILATGITIENKNPENQDVIGIQGNLDTLKISRLGIYDALFNKRINSKHVLLARPDLTVTLAKAVDDKTGKARNPVVFKNLKIIDGNITIFRHTKQKFLSIKDLNLDVGNIQMTEESVQKKLPLIFDRYDIRGKNFYFRPDNVYAITSQVITTEDGLMSLKTFAVVPLVSIKNFTRFNPNKPNLFDFKASEINFKEIAFDDNRIVLAHASFQKPDVKIYTTNAKPSKKKEFGYNINMDDVLLKNARINIIKPNGTLKLSAADLNLSIKKFVMNGETSKSSVPFGYTDFALNGTQIIFNTDSQNIALASLNFNPKKANLQNITVKPLSATAQKSRADFNIRAADININELKFVENKLKLDVQDVILNSLRGKLVAAENPQKKNNDYSGIHFPLNIRNLQVRNSNFTYEKDNEPLALKNLNFRIQNLVMDAKSAKNKFPFSAGAYTVNSGDLVYSTRFYTISAAAIKFNNNSLQISGASVKPKYSRAQFIRMIPNERDLYDVRVAKINMTGKWEFLADNSFLDASQVTFNNMNANIFRSKIPQDDPTEKLLYSRMLRNIKFPMYISNLDIKNSLLEYEEDTKKSDGPGKLTFNNFNLNVKNVNSAKMQGKPTAVPITISCRFMNASPMNLKWSFDTTNSNDTFTIAGNVADLPASRVNPFIEPYLKVRATGHISDLSFNFRGNYHGLNGTLNLKHQDLKVSVLKPDGDNNKLLSAVANIFVKTDSGKYPESVTVDNVARDKTKSFFNLFWKGIEEGLKKTLIGKGVDDTVENTKAALEQNKKDLQKTKQNVAEKVENVKEKVEEKSKGLKNVFKKKSE